jgi:hypothetical protein
MITSLVKWYNHYNQREGGLVMKRKPTRNPSTLLTAMVTLPDRGLGELH